MRYVLAILLPPLSMLLCGKFIQAIFCLLLMLTGVGWLIAAIWALLVANNYYNKKQTERLIHELRRTN